MSELFTYRFDMIGAYLARATEHPQAVIRKFAPDAADFEPVSIADCWMFSAAKIADPPSYITEVKAGRWVGSWERPCAPTPPLTTMEQGAVPIEDVRVFIGDVECVPVDSGLVSWSSDKDGE